MSPSWSERLGAVRCPLGWAGLRVCAWFAPHGTSPGPCPQPCGRPPVQNNSSALLGGASARRREEEHAARRLPRHTPRPPRPPRTTRAASRAQAGGRPPGKRNGLAREALRASLLVAPAVLPPPLRAQTADTKRYSKHAEQRVAREHGNTPAAAVLHFGPLGGMRSCLGSCVGPCLGWRVCAPLGRSAALGRCGRRRVLPPRVADLGGGGLDFFAVEEVPRNLAG